jgi:hypothetical protein
VHHGADVTGLQPLVGNGDRQDDTLMFFDHLCSRSLRGYDPRWSDLDRPPWLDFPPDD